MSPTVEDKCVFFPHWIRKLGRRENPLPNLTHQTSMISSTAVTHL